MPARTDFTPSSSAPPSIVDVRMHGAAATTAAYLVRGSHGTALVDSGPAASLPVTRAALAALGVEQLDWIVLTHVHLDHVGACGALAQDFPGARVAVHPRGERHVVDPSRLWQGASAVYGDRTDAIWGRPTPVAAERVVAIEDGGHVDLGDRRLRAVATPGHANHHHAWIDESTGDAFVGDALGMQVGGAAGWRATTPPAAFDLARALDSIERLRARRPQRIWLGHFGAADGGDADAVLDAGAATLREWTATIRSRRARGLSGSQLETGMREWLAHRERSWPARTSALFDLTSSPEIDVAGVVGWLERDAARS